MYYVFAQKRDGPPWEIDRLETRCRARAFARAREWLRDGRIVRVLRANEFGLYEPVPPEKWTLEDEGDAHSG